MLTIETENGQLSLHADEKLGLETFFKIMNIHVQHIWLNCCLPFPEWSSTISQNTSSDIKCKMDCENSESISPNTIHLLQMWRDFLSKIASIATSYMHTIMYPWEWKILELSTYIKHLLQPLKTSYFYDEEPLHIEITLSLNLVKYVFPCTFHKHVNWQFGSVRIFYRNW